MQLKLDPTFQTVWIKVATQLKHFVVVFLLFIADFFTINILLLYNVHMKSLKTKIKIKIRRNVFIIHCLQQVLHYFRSMTGRYPGDSDRDFRCTLPKQPKTAQKTKLLGLLLFTFTPAGIFNTLEYLSRKTSFKTLYCVQTKAQLRTHTKNRDFARTLQ